MHEVRVESLKKPESREGRMPLSANAGSLGIIFPQEVRQVLSGRLGWGDVQTITTGR